MKNSLVGVIAFFLSFPAYSCLYFNKAADPKAFQEKQREVLMFHDGELAHMIVKTSFEGKLPRELAWVLPIPSKPEAFQEVDPSLFVQIRKFFFDLNNNMVVLGGGLRANHADENAMPKSAIRVHSDVVVGDYNITPIEILSESGGRELNSFLEKKSFFGMSEEIQKPYLKKGAFFLAIAIKPSLNSVTTELKPLWIRYKSDELRFPLRFTHDYRTFDLTLYFYGFSESYELMDGMNYFDHDIHLAGGSLNGAEQGVPVLGDFLKPWHEKLVSNRSKFKDYFYRLKAAKIKNKPHLKSSLENDQFESWDASIFLQRYSVSGVNHRFKTRSLKEDPGFKAL